MSGNSLPITFCKQPFSLTKMLITTYPNLLLFLGKRYFSFRNTTTWAASTAQQDAHENPFAFETVSESRKPELMQLHIMNILPLHLHLCQE